MTTVARHVAVLSLTVLVGCTYVTAPDVTAPEPVVEPTALAFGTPSWAARAGMFPVQIVVDGRVVGQITEPWTEGSICQAGRGRLIVPLAPGPHDWTATGFRVGVWTRRADVIAQSECAPRHLLCESC